METKCCSREQATGRLMILTFGLALLVSRTHAATIYFTDDFENGLHKWSVGGDSWQLTDSYYCSPGNCVADNPAGNYPMNANSTMAMKLQHRVDLSESTFPVLIFWHQIGVFDGDYGLVEVSQDYGFTWTEIASFTNTHRSTWSREQVDLSDYTASPILIRFRLRDDGGYSQGMFSGGPTTSWGWYIDDVQISDLDTTTIPFPLFEDFENGLDNWITGDWQFIESYSRSSSHCLADNKGFVYPQDACSDLILAHPIDLTESTFPVLMFWHQIGVFDGDYGRVQVSQDYGFTWTDIFTMTNTEYLNWYPEMVDLSPYRSTPILIRFRLRDDGGYSQGQFTGGPTTSWGWLIDDLEIKELIPLELCVEMTDLTVTDCPTVQATVIVTDSDGIPVTGLPASAFSVYEDGEAQAASVVECTRQSSCTSLILDYSWSMTANDVLNMQSAASQFVNWMAEFGEGYGEVVKFAEDTELTQEYTRDPGALSAAIWLEPTVKRHETHLYDAISLAIRNAAAQEMCDSKAVIVITDGKDTGSQQCSATGTIELAERMGVRVFTIGLGDAVDENVLTAIATLTGGVYYYAPTSEELEAIYSAIAGALQNQYLVEFQTTVCGAKTTTDSEHEVMIKVETGGSAGLDTGRFHCPVECGQ